MEGHAEAKREGGEEEDTDSMDGSGLYSLTEDQERDEERRERTNRGEKRAARKRNRPGSGSNHSTSSDEDDDEEEHKDEDDDEEDDEDDNEAMEAWLGAELRDLRGPVWRAVPSLRSREIGRGSHQFVRRVCGARGLVQRLELQGRMERHTGCVNTLHFNPTGTRLASGSDDLRVVIWDWAIRQAVLEFDSGHKSNVFQVGKTECDDITSCHGNTAGRPPDFLKLAMFPFNACRQSSCLTAETPPWPCVLAMVRSE